MSASNVNKPKSNRSYFPSFNNTTRIHSIKTGRLHILHSDIEKKLFLLLNSSVSASVIDILEQFPLTSIFTKKKRK